MMQTARAVTFLILLYVHTGCVTVNLPMGDGGKKAEGVSFKTPSAPFVKDDREQVDAAFKNPKNGNVISYLSDCKDPSDPSLDSIVQGVLNGLTDLKFEHQESPMIQGREGRRVKAYGKVDGVPSAIDLLVFKRNQCNYILSYVGVRRSFTENSADFQAFVEGFRAP